MITTAQLHVQLTLLHKNLKSLTREHKTEFLRLTVIQFQALQEKVPERPSVRPSVPLELSPLLILLFCFVIFSFFVENHLLGNTLLSYGLRVTGLAGKRLYISPYVCILC